MFSRVEWLIAQRYLKTKRKESFITVISWLSLIGITLGVAVLIIVMSVMSGFKKELIKSIVGIDGHLSVSSLYKPYIMDYQRLIQVIKEHKEVTHVGASINTQALISTRYSSAGVMVKAMSLEDILQRNINLSTISSRNLDIFKNGEKVVLIGNSLFYSLLAEVGEPLKLIFPDFNYTVVGSIPKFVTLNSLGVFKTGMFQYDNNMVIIPIQIASKLFNTNGVQSLEIFINNPSKANIVKEYLTSKLKEGFYITTWQENNITLITALNTERNVMFIILFLIIMVATFNIMSGLIMLVRSKTKEIAILKTMGFNNYNIQKIFFLIGLRTGVMGTILGIVLGVLFSLNIENIREFVQNVLQVNVFNESVYFLSKLPAEVSILEVSIIASISILLSILTSIYPAKKAVKIIVAKALHYE